MGGGGCRKITSSPAGDPALEGKVSISEEATVGAELSVDTTQLEGTGTITYQWESGETADGDFAPIEGAAGAAYTPLDADAGKYIRVTVTREGYAGSVSSNSAPVKAAPEPEPEPPLPELTGKVWIEGSAIRGRMLAAFQELAGEGEISYQWERSGSAGGDYEPIEGATTGSYRIVLADAGNWLRVSVKREGYSGSKESDPKGQVALPQLEGEVSVTGSAIRRETLTASLELSASPESDGVDYEELKLQWQWLRGETADGGFEPIEGAEAESYRIVLADKDKWLKARVESEGYTGSLTSEDTKGPVTLPRIGGSVSISQAEAKVGVELTADPGELDVDEDGDLLFTWWTSESPNSGYTYEGAEGANYTIRAADVGKYIKVNVSHTGYEGDLMSAAAVGPVTKSPISGTVSITGEAKTGVELSVDRSALEGKEDLTCYWWVSKTTDKNGDYEPHGTTSETYRPSRSDMGKWLKVAVEQEGYDGRTADSEPFGPLELNVTSVTVSGPVILSKGMSAAYTAKVGIYGDSNGSDNVTWSIVEENSKASGTKIDNTGKLTIAADETLRHITVIAESNDNSLVKSDPLIVTITDPLTWTQGGNSGIGGIPNGIAFGETASGGRFVVVNRSSQAAYSDDGGASWQTSGDTTFGSNPINDIAYGETASGGRFVAVGGGGKAAYSADGVNWTASGDTTFGRDFAINAIVFGAGRFVAVGAAGKAAYSTDGVNWTASDNTQFSGYNISDIAFGGGNFVAVGYNGKAAYSFDGAAWYPADTTLQGNLTAIGYGGEGDNAKFVTGHDGKMAYSSKDGVSWTAVNPPSDNNQLFKGALAGIAFGGGKFVAVSGANNNTRYSADGVNWTEIAPFNSGVYRIAFGDGRFVVVGENGKTAYSNLQE